MGIAEALCAFDHLYVQPALRSAQPIVESAGQGVLCAFQATTNALSAVAQGVPMVFEALGDAMVGGGGRGGLSEDDSLDSESEEEGSGDEADK